MSSYPKKQRRVATPTSKKPIKQTKKLRRDVHRGLINTQKRKFIATNGGDEEEFRASYTSTSFSYKPDQNRIRQGRLDTRNSNRAISGGHYNEGKDQGRNAQGGDAASPSFPNNYSHRNNDNNNRRNNNNSNEPYRSHGRHNTPHTNKGSGRDSKPNQDRQNNNNNNNNNNSSNQNDQPRRYGGNALGHNVVLRRKREAALIATQTNPQAFGISSDPTRLLPYEQLPRNTLFSATLFNNAVVTPHLLPSLTQHRALADDIIQRHKDLQQEYHTVCEEAKEGRKYILDLEQRTFQELLALHLSLEDQLELTDADLARGELDSSNRGIGPDVLQTLISLLHQNRIVSSRQRLAASYISMLRQEYPDARGHMFGSLVTGLASPEADCDVSIVGVAPRSAVTSPDLILHPQRLKRLLHTLDESGLPQMTWDQRGAFLDVLKQLDQDQTEWDASENVIDIIERHISATRGSDTSIQIAKDLIATYRKKMSGGNTDNNVDNNSNGNNNNDNEQDDSNTDNTGLDIDTLKRKLIDNPAVKKVEEVFSGFSWSGETEVAPEDVFEVEDLYRKINSNTPAALFQLQNIINETIERQTLDDVDNAIVVADLKTIKQSVPPTRAVEDKLLQTIPEFISEEKQKFHGDDFDNIFEYSEQNDSNTDGNNKNKKANKKDKKQQQSPITDPYDVSLLYSPEDGDFDVTQQQQEQQSPTENDDDIQDQATSSEELEILETLTPDQKHILRRHQIFAHATFNHHGPNNTPIPVPQTKYKLGTKPLYQRPTSKTPFVSNQQLSTAFQKAIQNDEQDIQQKQKQFAAEFQSLTKKQRKKVHKILLPFLTFKVQWGADEKKKNKHNDDDNGEEEQSNTKNNKLYHKVMQFEPDYGVVIPPQPPAVYRFYDLQSLIKRVQKKKEKQQQQKKKSIVDPESVSTAWGGFFTPESNHDEDSSEEQTSSPTDESSENKDEVPLHLPVPFFLTQDKPEHTDQIAYNQRHNHRNQALQFMNRMHVDTSQTPREHKRLRIPLVQIRHSTQHSHHLMRAVEWDWLIHRSWWAVYSEIASTEQGRGVIHHWFSNYMKTKAKQLAQFQEQFGNVNNDNNNNENTIDTTMMTNNEDNTLEQQEQKEEYENLTKHSHTIDKLSKLLNKPYKSKHQRYKGSTILPPTISSITSKPTPNLTGGELFPLSKLPAITQDLAQNHPDYLHSKNPTVLQPMAPLTHRHEAQYFGEPHHSASAPPKLQFAKDNVNLTTQAHPRLSPLTTSDIPIIPTIQQDEGLRNTIDAVRTGDKNSRSNNRPFEDVVFNTSLVAPNNTAGGLAFNHQLDSPSDLFNLKPNAHLQDLIKMQLENQAQDPTLVSPLTDGIVFPGRLPEVHGDSTKWSTLPGANTIQYYSLPSTTPVVNSAALWQAVKYVTLTLLVKNAGVSVQSALTLTGLKASTASQIFDFLYKKEKKFGNIKRSRYEDAVLADGVFAISVPPVAFPHEVLNQKQKKIKHTTIEGQEQVSGEDDGVSAATSDGLSHRQQTNNGEVVDNDNIDNNNNINPQSHDETSYDETEDDIHKPTELPKGPIFMPVYGKNMDRRSLLDAASIPEHVNILPKLFAEEVSSHINQHYDAIEEINEEQRSAQNNNNNNTSRSRYSTKYNNNIDEFEERRDEAENNLIYNIKKTVFTMSNLARLYNYDPFRVKEIHLDLSFNNDIGTMNSALLREYNAIDPRVQPLILLVKQWAQKVDLHGAKNGYFSSYGYSCLTIFFLQQVGILPTLQRYHTVAEDFKDYYDGNTTNTKTVQWTFQNVYNGYALSDDFIGYGCRTPELRDMSICDLFVGFLDYYANFDFTKHVVSIREGRPQSKEMKNNYSWPVVHTQRLQQVQPSSSLIQKATVDRCAQVVGGPELHNISLDFRQKVQRDSNPYFCREDEWLDMPVLPVNLDNLDHSPFARSANLTPDQYDAVILREQVTQDLLSNYSFDKQSVARHHIGWQKEWVINPGEYQLNDIHRYNEDGNYNQYKPEPPNNKKSKRRYEDYPSGGIEDNVVPLKNPWGYLSIEDPVDLTHDLSRHTSPKFATLFTSQCQISKDLYQQNILPYANNKLDLVQSIARDIQQISQKMAKKHIKLQNAFANELEDWMADMQDSLIAGQHKKANPTLQDTTNNNNDPLSSDDDNELKTNKNIARSLPNDQRQELLSKALNSGPLRRKLETKFVKTMQTRHTSEEMAALHDASYFSALDADEITTTTEDTETPSEEPQYTGQIDDIENFPTPSVQKVYYAVLQSDLVQSQTLPIDHIGRSRIDARELLSELDHELETLGYGPTSTGLPSMYSDILRDETPHNRSQHRDNIEKELDKRIRNSTLYNQPRYGAVASSIQSSTAGDDGGFEGITTQFPGNSFSASKAQQQFVEEFHGPRREPSIYNVRSLAPPGTTVNVNGNKRAERRVADPIPLSEEERPSLRRGGNKRDVEGQRKRNREKQQNQDNSSSSPILEKPIDQTKNPIDQTSATINSLLQNASKKRKK